MQVQHRDLDLPQMSDQPSLQQQPQQPPIPNRSRSTSESQNRVSRAEKRMGRLFRQQSSSAVHSHTLGNHALGSFNHAHNNNNNNNNNSNTTVPNSYTNSLHTKQLSLDQNIPSSSSSDLNCTFNTSLSSSNNNPHDDIASPDSMITPSNTSNFDNPFAHSNSSSISSQIGSTNSSSTTPSISSTTQTSRKFVLQHQQNNSISSNVFSSPEVTSSNMFSNSSLATLVNSTSNVTSSTIDNSVSKLSTLQEHETAKVSKSLDTLLMMSKKFVYFHNQFLSTLTLLNININLPLTNFHVYMAVLENVEKKVSNKGHDQITESMKAHLTLSLVNSMSDLKKFIENLKLYFKSNQLDVPCSTLRVTYFTLFSLFIELTNICKIIIPFSKPKFNNSLTSSSSSNHVSRNNSTLLQKNRSSFVINRIPAPNPQLSSQSSSNTKFTSLSRQHSKLDRQDSDLSVFSNNTNNNSSDSNNNSGSNTIISSNMSTPTTDDDKLFTLINHTVQAANVVYNQIDEAIAKSGSMLCENKSLDSNTNNPDEDSNGNDLSYKVKELKNQCLISMDKKKKVEYYLSIVSNESANSIKDLDSCKHLYEHTNSFLKSIINILAATKVTIEDLPALNEVISSLSILTKATKELTIKLESSSLKQLVLNNSASTNSLTEQPNLSSIPSMSNIQADPQSQSVTSPIMQQQLESNTIRRMNKLRHIPEHNETGLSAMKQHIKNLEINTTDAIKQQQHQPLGVTTPLIASIGPSVASAVLPIQSPLKPNSSTSLTFTNNVSSNSASSTTIDAHLNSSNNTSNTNTNSSTTPLYFGDGNGGIQSEYNPFDRLVPR